MRKINKSRGVPISNFKGSYSFPISGVYKITAPDCRAYIGASINICARISNHKARISFGTTKLNASMRKYSFKKHMIEIIERCDKELLPDKELQYIMLYNAHIEGLNHRVSRKGR